MKTEMEKKIEALMKEWADYCHRKWPDAIFVEDGPFPHYGQQKIKILFIGRELYGKASKSDPRTIKYWEERESMQKLGVFQSRLLYLAYGIINSECTEEDWMNMDDAQKSDCVFAMDVKEKCGAFSYAFMNASKILNTQSTTIGRDFKDFINDKVNRTFFIREIELLAPDIIVSGNLNDTLFFGTDKDNLPSEFKGRIKPSPYGNELNDKNCFVWEYTLGCGKDIRWLDGYHFSARVEPYEHLYGPICERAKFFLDKKIVIS